MFFQILAVNPSVLQNAQPRDVNKPGVDQAIPVEIIRVFTSVQSTLLVLPSTAGMTGHIPRIPRHAWLQLPGSRFGDSMGDITSTTESNRDDREIHGSKPYFVLNNPVEEFCSTSTFGSFAPLAHSGTPWPYVTSSFTYDGAPSLTDLDAQAAPCAPGSTLVNVVDLPYWYLPGIPSSRNITGYFRPRISHIHVSDDQKLWVTPEMRNGLISFAPKTDLGLPFMFRELTELENDPWFSSLFNVKYERRPFPGLRISRPSTVITELQNDDHDHPPDVPHEMHQMPDTLMSRVSDVTAIEWRKLLYTLRHTIAALHNIPEVATALDWVPVDHQSVALPSDIDIQQWRKDHATKRVVDTVVECFSAILGQLDFQLAVVVCENKNISRIRQPLQAAGLKQSWLDSLQARASKIALNISTAHRSGLYLDLRIPAHRHVTESYMRVVLDTQLPLLVDWPPLQEIVELWKPKVSVVDGRKSVSAPWCLSLQQLYPNQGELERAVLAFHQIADAGYYFGLVIQPDLHPWNTEAAYTAAGRHSFTWRNEHLASSPDHILISHEDVPVSLWAEQHDGWLTSCAVAPESKLQVLQAYQPYQIVLAFSDNVTPASIDVYGGMPDPFATQSFDLPSRPLAYSEASIELDGDQWPRAWEPEPEALATVRAMFEAGAYSGRESPLDKEDPLQWDGSHRIGPSRGRREAEANRRRWYERDDASGRMNLDYYDAENYDYNTTTDGADTACGVDPSDAPGAEYDPQAPFDRRWHAGIWGWSTGHLIGRLIKPNELHDIVGYFGFVQGSDSAMEAQESLESDKHRLANIYGIHSSHHDTLDWNALDVKRLKHYTELLDRGQLLPSQMGDWPSISIPRHGIWVYRDTVDFPREVDDTIASANAPLLQEPDKRDVFVIKFGYNPSDRSQLCGLLLQKPLIVAQCLRWLATREDGESPRDMHRFLLEQLVSRGMPHQTFSLGSSQEQMAVYSSFDYGSLERPLDHTFDHDDLWHWEARLSRMLQAPRVARAALGKGGFIWRIAHEYGPSSMMSLAVHGPSATSVLIGNSTIFPVAYWGDRLSLGEERFISGTYSLIAGPYMIESVPTVHD